MFYGVINVILYIPSFPARINIFVEQLKILPAFISDGIAYKFIFF